MLCFTQPQGSVEWGVTIPRLSGELRVLVSYEVQSVVNYVKTTVLFVCLLQWMSGSFIHSTIDRDCLLRQSTSNSSRSKRSSFFLDLSSVLELNLDRCFLFLFSLPNEWRDDTIPSLWITNLCFLLLRNLSLLLNINYFTLNCLKRTMWVLTNFDM